jgi:hypothetical protein
VEPHGPQRRLRVAVRERRTRAAVHVHVDEAGDEHGVAEIDVGGPRWRSRPEGRDPVTVDLHPARPYREIVGDERASREDHRSAPEKPPTSAVGRKERCSDVALVLDIALDDLQGGAADRGGEVAVGPWGREPGPQVWELLAEQSRRATLGPL